MDLRNVLGGLLQQGMTRSTHNRMDRASGGIIEMLGGGRTGGGGLEAALGQLGSMLQGSGGAGRSATPGRATAPSFESGVGRGTGYGRSPDQGSGLGGLLGGVPEFSKTQAGGIGAVLGSVLMGGQGRAVGALKGGAIGVLAAMALSALRERQAGTAAGATRPEPSGPTGGGDITDALKRNLGTNDAEIERMTSPETAQLVLRGMLEAAKSDGQISPDEMKRIMGKLGEDGDISDEERRFILDEMGRPADLDGLVRDIPNREIAAQVYAAALLAIEVDTPAERQFMNDLARRTGLDDGTAQRLQEFTGARV